MTKSFLSKASNLSVIILLALNLLVTFISSNPEAKAKENLQYKVVVQDNKWTYREFEALCNKMANEGWRYINTNIIYGDYNNNSYWYTFEK